MLPLVASVALIMVTGSNYGPHLQAIYRFDTLAHCENAAGTLAGVVKDAKFICLDGAILSQDHH